LRMPVSQATLQSSKQALGLMPLKRSLAIVIGRRIGMGKKLADLTFTSRKRADSDRFGDTNRVRRKRK
jgi:hypothetical protein